MYAIIGGGGKVGFYLGRELINQGHEVLIIEQLADRAEFISNELGNVVLRGNADEAKTLADAGAERADVVIAVTGDDEDNLIICQVAKKRFGSKRTLARINEPRNESVFKMLGIDATINVTEVLLRVLEQQIPQSSLVTLVRLDDAGVEIVETRLTDRSPVVGRAIRSLDLPGESIVTLILRGDQAIFPNGDTVLAVGDDVVALTRTDQESKLRRILLPE